MAGVPTAVLQDARDRLAQLEQQAASRDPLQADLFGQPPQLASAVPEAAAPPTPSALELALAAIDPDTLTPRAALDLLYEWRGQFDTRSAEEP